MIYALNLFQYSMIFSYLFNALINNYPLRVSLNGIIIISMHLEDRLSMVRNCLEEGGSILFKSITSNRNPTDNSMLKTCFYHMKSLNESIQHDRGNFLLKKENQPCELPKIQGKQGKKQRQSAAISILPRTSSLLNKLAERSELRHDASCSDLLKLSSSILLRNNATPPENPKQFQIKVRKRPNFKNIFHKPTILPKQQRYFENSEVKISPERVQTLGYYEASNIYKTKNMQNQLKEMKVVATKPQFNPIKLTNKHDLFLTDLQGQTIDFCVQEYIEKELNKQRNCERVIQQCDSIRMSKNISNEEAMGTVETKKDQIQQTDLYITIKDYAFVKDQSFKLFKAKNIEIWGDVLQAFDNIVRCMHQQKISYLKVKSDKLTIWSGKKIHLAEITRILGLQRLIATYQRIENVCFGFLDRLKVRRIRQRIARQQSLARWVCIRLKTFTLLRKLRREKQAKAIKLHRQLAQELQWDTEIHIPSFSVDQFQRNTTQYLESFENIYHAMWRNSSKHLVLILPTINENIIKILQTRLRVNRSLTIICPEIHQTFPNNLPLAAQVLFSYETLKRIQKAIDGRVAVLVPGCDRGQSKMQQQMLLSEYLNVPLLCSLQMENNSSAQKQFFMKCLNNCNQPYCIIAPGSTSQQVLNIFCQLLFSYPEQRKWIIKLQSQFKGRGIATIKINPSKYFKSDNMPSQNKRLLLEHLKSNFKLKLKINFENSLYMVQDFMKQLQSRGGVIQEEVQALATYQICLYKHAICEFLYLYRLYGTDYSNKIWLSQEVGPELEAIITSMQDQIEAGNYLGHLSATICKGTDGNFYGIDLKLHQTYSSSAVSFIKMIEQKRALSQEEAANINYLPTKRGPIHTHSPSLDQNMQLTFQNYSYLIVPNLVFTDIEEEVKAKLIEEMMAECWGDRHVKLHEQCRLFLSMGVDFSMIFIGRDVKRLKKRAIDTVRQLNDRTSSYRKYRGKEVIRDVFQYGDIIRALSQIKQ